jgi:hypothetical protein
MMQDATPSTIVGTPPRMLSESSLVCLRLFGHYHCAHYQDLGSRSSDETPEILDREPSVDHSVDVTRDMIEFDGILVDTAFVGSQLLGHTDIGDGLSLQP